jgi:hypothetical protein
MRLRRHSRARRGATLVEGAIIASAFLLLLLGMIDLGVGVFRHNVISQAARHGVRRAIVHGEKVLPGYDGGRWKPSASNTVGPVAASASSHPILAEIRPMLVACNPDATMVTVDWLDSGDAVEQRVRVTITTPYQPILTSFFGGSITLTASSTMPIAH